jgi:excinuclease ABC subunit B
MYEELAIRIEMFGDEIEKIMTLHPLTGEILRDETEIYIFPATHYVTPFEKIDQVLDQIIEERDRQIDELRSELQSRDDQLLDRAVDVEELTAPGLT